MKKSHKPSPAGKGKTARPPRPAHLSTEPSTNGRSGPLSDEQKQIQALVDLLKRNNLTELEWECETFRVRLRYDAEPKVVLTAAHEPVHPASASAVQPERSREVEDATHLVTITSPIVGTFYRSPSADADPYVDEDDFVKKGQVLCIVEAMKLMNEIESEVDGRIIKVLAESTKPVEYGEPLFLIDPTATG